jgi:hypothetical protein
MPPAPRKKPTRSTKKPYHYSKDALEKELRLIMEGSAPTPKKKPTIAERFPPRQKPKLSSVSFERLRQKYADKAAKLDLGEEVDEAVWATHPDDTRSSALLNLLEPYLRENPMAQLGFDVVGGGEGIMKLFIDSRENMPEWGLQVPEIGFTSSSYGDRIIRARLRKEHKEQNIEALTGFKDPFKEFHSSGEKRPFVMYRDAVGTEWPEAFGAATIADRQIKQGLATLLHELGHAGDRHLQAVSGTENLSELFQRALDYRRAEKFKEGPHKLPELRKGPTHKDPVATQRRRKRGIKKYPHPYEHSSMERSLKVLLNRLRTPPERGKVID